MRKIYLLLLAVCLTTIGKAQSIANYTFLTNATSSLSLDKDGNPIDMSTGTTELSLAGATLPNTVYHDDDASVVTNLPFSFVFMSGVYDRFSVNSNGQMKLGSAAVTTAISGTNITGPALNTAYLAPFTGDNAVQATGKVHYKVFGSAPNRVFVFEWVSFRVPFSSTPGTGSQMQIRLYETSNVVEYVYGAMFNNSASALTGTVGLSSSNTATTSTYIATINTTPTNTPAASWTTTSFTASVAMTGLDGAADGTRRVFRWTPPAAPADPTALNFTSVGLSTMTLNWTDNASTETGYLVYRSTDNITFSLVNTTAANTTSYIATGLTPSTLYYWKVYAGNEGGVSNPVSGSQSTTSCSLAAATIPVGASSTFTTITAAITNLVNNGLTGPQVIELQTDYVPETSLTLPLVPCASAVNTITIRPAAAVAAPIVFSSSAAAPTVNISGGQYYIIDGRNGGAGTNKFITITNTSTTGQAVQFINDGANNVINYCTLSGANTGTTSGVVVFSTTTGTIGNSNNTISNSDIRDAATPATIGVYSAGTAAFPNNNNTVSSCNIYNFYNSTSTTFAGVGINLGANNNNWTINGNSFYQTATRTTFGAAGVFNFIAIGSNTVNGVSITNNFFGGTAPACGGTPLTLTATTTLVFRGIQVTAGTTTPTSIQGNTFQNIAVTSTSTSTAQSIISAVTGSFNIGNVTGNTIGSQSATGNITFSISGSAAIFSAILCGTGTPGAINISNNTIGGISVANTGAPATGTSVRGIGVQATPTSLTINNNIVGSTTTANSLTSSTSSSLLGIFLATINAGTNVTNNTVANLSVTSVSTTAQLVGIAEQGSSGGSFTTTGNTIRNLSNSSANTGTGVSASVIGISHSAATTTGQTISQNSIFALSNTSAAVSNITMAGIYYAGPTTGTNVVSRNNIYGLSLSATGTTPVMHGINVNGGLTTFHNNMIDLGNGVSGNININGINEGVGTNNFYYNSVYIGGSVTGALNTFAFNSAVTVNTRNFQNNIFVNARANAGAGRSYAVQVAGTAANPAGLTMNNNDYFTTGTGTVLGRFNALDVASLAAWQTAVGQDAASLSVDPAYIAPTAATPDLHITSGSSTLESAALTIAGISIDYDNDTRPGTPSGSNSGVGPDIGADEFIGINPNLCSGAPSQGGTVSASTLIPCTGTSVTFTLTPPFTGGAGISYQWQTSPVGANTWSDVAGATSTVSAFTVNSSVDVRCLVKCTVSGQNTPSAVLTINAGACQFTVTRSATTFTSINATGTGFTGFGTSDDAYSAATNIGFSFPYKGVSYTQLLVNTNGFIGLGATSPGASFTNNLSGSTFYPNVIAPFWDDLVAQGNAGGASVTNFIKWQLDGSAPNRIFTVEWTGMEQFGYGGPNLNFQVKLHENGVIDFVYGTMELFNGTTPSVSPPNQYSYSQGLTGSAAQTGNVKFQSLQRENGTCYNVTDPTNLAIPPECNVIYTFTDGVYTNCTPAAVTPPANDELAGAQPVAVNPTPCTSLCGTYFTTKGATASATPASSCAAAPDDDVWFSFTAPPSGSVSLNVKGATGFDAVVGLYDNTGTEVVGLGCIDATTGNATGLGQTETLNPTGLTNGATYYVRVSHKGAGSGSASGFSICVNEVIAPPANDDPCGAISLTVNATCTPYSNNVIPSTTSFISATTTTSNGVTAPSCTGAGGSVNDVWFSFVAPASGTVNVDVTPVAGVNPGMQLFSAAGTCPGLTLTAVSCTNANGTGVAETGVFSSLTAGATYYVRVYQHPSGIGGTPVNNSQFSICVYAPLPTCPTTYTPVNNASACLSASATTVSWSGATNATSYDVYFDPGSGPATTLVSAAQAGTSYNAGILAAGTYSWRVDAKNANGTTTCTSQSFTVNALPTINITPTGPIVLCEPNTQLLSLGSTSAGSPVYQWKQNGTNIIVNGTSSTYTATSSGSYTLFVTDGGTTCSNTSNAVNVTINTQPQVPQITPASLTICPAGNAVLLTATGSSSASTLFSENFNGVTAGSTTSGNLPVGWTGSSLTAAPRIWGVVASAQTGSTLGGGNFLYCESDLYSANQVRAEVITPAMDATGFLSLNLKVKQYYNDLLSGSGTDSARVYVSNDGGATWVLQQEYDVDQGTGFSSGGATNTTIPINVVPFTNNMKIKLVYNSDASGNDWYWAVDDFVVDGNISADYTWATTTGLYTDAAATTAYTGTATPTVFASPLTTTVYTVTATNTYSCTNSSPITVTVTTPANASGLAAVTGGAQVCQSSAVAVAGTRYFDASCDLISKVVPSGASPVTGTVNSCVVIDATVQSYNSKPYVQRHFDIEPATNAATATGTITLYVLQSEFDAYNANNGGLPDLPTGSADATGIANLRVTQFHGTGNAPGNYTGASVLIDPVDASIVWNATRNWWEITFDVTGFSGFYIHTTTGGPLPTGLLTFAGQKEGAVNKLRWTTVNESNNRGFDVQRSTDGINYTSIGFVGTQALGGTSSSNLNYTFTDNAPAGNKQYYRLRQVDNDNRSRLSNVVLIKGDKPVVLAIDGIFPNPAQSQVNVLIGTPNRDKLTLVVMDANGKTVIQKVVSVEAGTNTVPVDISRLTNGSYIVKLVCATNCEMAVSRFVKQ